MATGCELIDDNNSSSDLDVLFPELIRGHSLWNKGSFVLRYQDLGEVQR